MAKSTYRASSQAPIPQRSSKVEGKPFPDFFLNTAGVRDGTITALDEGEYIVWIEMETEEIITPPLTVGAGDNDALVPAQDSGSRSARLP